MLKMKENDITNMESTDSKIINITNSNFMEICRSCIVNRGVIDLFQGYFQKLTFSQLIYSFTAEKISPEDGISKKICLKCSNLLIDSYSFLKKLEANQTHIRRLHKILLQNPTDVALNTLNNDIMRKRKLLKISNEVKTDLHDSAKNVDSKNNLIGPMKNFPEYGEVITEHSSKNSLSGAENPKLENLFKLNTRYFSTGECCKLEESPSQEITVENQLKKKENNIHIKTDYHTLTDRLKILTSPKKSEKNDNFRLLERKNKVIDRKQFRDTIEVITIIGIESDEEKINFKLETDNSKNNHNTMKKNEFQCFECLKHFKTMQNMLKHSDRTGHIIPPRFKCEICSKAFKTSMAFKAHSRCHTQGNFKSVCDVCGASVLMRNFKRHLYTHSGKSNVCPYCTKSFTQKGTLLYHIKSIHEGVSPHVLCYICGKGYARLTELNQHLNKHTEEELKDYPHRCEVCQKCFTSDASLRLHNSYHNGPRKLKGTNHKSVSRKGKNNNTNPRMKSFRECLVCRKMISPNGIRKHVHMHEDLRPFQCSVCGKKFRQHPHLQSHMNIHLGLKNYKCEYCEKQFRHKTTWITHTRMHTGETPFVCSVCNKGFYHSSTMKKHEESHYKNRPKTSEMVVISEFIGDAADSLDKHESTSKPKQL